MKEYRTFLGRGWSFPPAFDRNGTPTQLSAYEEKIRQSLWTLLSTSPGERVHRHDYGCPMRRYMFDQCSDLDCLDLESNEEVGILRIFILLKMMNTSEEFTVKDALKSPKIVFMPKQKMHDAANAIELVINRGTSSMKRENDTSESGSPDPMGE